MSPADAEEDPLSGLAAELRELGSRLAGIADALLARSTAPAAGSTFAPPVAGSAFVPPAAGSSFAPPVAQGPAPAPVPSGPVPPPTWQAQPPVPGAGWQTPVPPAGWQPPMPPPQYSVPQYAAPQYAGPPQYAAAPMSELPVPADRRASATWDRWGSRSLAWIGGAITLLGIVLLLVLAIQRGWLGPVPRLLCGLGFAACLIAIGRRVRRTPSGQIGGFALTATGIVTVYLDIVAATALYGYLPDAAGLLAGLVVAVAGLWLAGRWDSPTLAIFVVLAAAACAPIITHGVTALLVAFLLVLAWSVTPVLLRRRWRWLAVAAYAPPLVACLVLDRLGTGPTVTVVLALITMLAMIGVAGATVLRGEDDPVAIGLLIAAPTPVMAAAPLLARPWAVGCLAAVSVLLFAIWAMSLLATRRLPARFTAVAGAAGTVTLFQAVATAAAGNAAVFTIAVLCQAILLTAAAYRIRGAGILIAAGAYTAVGLVAALAGPLPPALLINTPYGHVDTGMLRSAVIVAVLFVFAALVGAGTVMRLEVGSPGIWWPLGVVGLYGFSGIVLGVVLLVAPDQQGFLIGQVLVTIGWAGCALLLLVRGIQALPARMAGLALVACALTKLIVFDLSTLDGVARVAAFLGSGLVLLAAGARYARAVTGLSRRNGR